MAKIFIVTGPPGVGKGSVLRKLLEENLPLYWAKTLTTRPYHKGEKATSQRIFVSEKKFKTALKKGQLLEYVWYIGHAYGTPKSELLKAYRMGKNPILEIDPEGAIQVRKLFSNARIIFLTTSLLDLKKRMLKRGRDEPAEIQRRLEKAHKIIEEFKDYDIKVINRENKLEEAVEEIKDFITECLKEPIKVLAFGTFDKFHSGHAYFLKEAKKLGDILIVAVARNKSVEMFKGKKPSQSERKRLARVKKENIADEVMLEDKKDYFKAVYQASPDILALGYDQKPIHTKMFESLKRMKLMGVKIKKIKSFKPEIYHSSFTPPHH